FKHADLMKYLEGFKASLGDVIKLEQVGTSAENRSINLLTLGKGKTKVFLWSQMHGDEPTATMALLDILNYISLNCNSVEIQKILSETTLLIIPMLNPDGAERFQRRTSQGIDMNRDALSLQTPEAKVLKSLRDKYNPEIGFNLHDQDPRYTVGDSGDVSTIALLAPSFNKEKSDNPVRLRAKKITAEIANTLRQFIPRNISRYDDTFEPRAFGDNVQKWGTSTILVESGGWKDDPAKMYIRKLNCVALLTELYSIATNAYEKVSIADYENIPMNTRNLFDVIVEKITLTFGNEKAPVIADVAVNFEYMKESNGNFKRIARVMDVGDLSIFFAHEKLNGAGKNIEGSKVEINEIIDMGVVRSVIKK
ncbi:MAG: M14 family zinc carboxypeptidase, partial [Bacteroidota bacterium]|nr:M14 family zinc carboxypeptidase [Bacteroidota bacterium]